MTILESNHEVTGRIRPTCQSLYHHLPREDRPRSLNDVGIVKTEEHSRPLTPPRPRRFSALTRV